MPGNTEQLGLPMLAVAVGSCYLLLFMKRFANIVRVFMTIILTVSDLNVLRVLFSGADHSLGANRPLKSHISALNMGLILTSLTPKLLKRRMSLSLTNKYLLTCPSLTSFTAPGMRIDSPEGKDSASGHESYTRTVSRYMVTRGTRRWPLLY